MVAIRVLWLILLLVYTEKMMAAYFQVEMRGVSANDSYRVISSSTAVSCVLACKRETDCKLNGRDADGNCHLFKDQPSNDEIGKEISIFKEGGLYAQHLRFSLILSQKNPAWYQ